MITLPTHTGAAPSPARMRQTAQAFEAQVLAQLMQPAFETVDTSKSAFGGGSAEAQWRPMLVEAFAAGAARSGQGIGIQDMVLRHMLRLQDQARNPTPTEQENRP
jgi:peptidoglycan hydrolase FlgJ